MMRLLSVAVVLAGCAAPMLSSAEDGATWASKLDYTLNESRDKPIVCKQGDIERQAGRTLAQVFGDKWPAQPQPDPNVERVRAQLTQLINHRSVLKGMPVQDGVVVYAVLVDASGEPLQAEVLCASTDGYDKATKRMAMRSEYRPAVINGTPITSVFVHVTKFKGAGG